MKLFAAKVVLSSLIFLSLTISCARSEKETIQGMWEAITLEIVVENRVIQNKMEVSGIFCEFNDDRYYEYTTNKSGVLDTTVHTYTMTKKSIKLEPLMGEPEIIYDYRFFNDDMNLVLRQVNREGNGSEMMFKRK